MPCAHTVFLSCKHDLVEDLTSYLYNASLLKYIEGYVQKVSPQKTPKVRHLLPLQWGAGSLALMLWLSW
jgi:hypothetical protein